MTILERICNDIHELTDEDINDVEDTIRRQKEFISPLKPVKQARYNNLGYYNGKVLKLILKIKELIKVEGVKLLEK